MRNLHEYLSRGAPRIWILALATTLTVGGFGTAHAQCDVPLIAQQVSVPPNVMIVFDSSGSMNTAVYHEDYDQSVTYSGGFGTNSIYQVAQDSVQVHNGRSAQLVSGLHGQQSRYDGNYMNWIYWHATDAQRASIPTVTRQMVANAAVKAIMNQASGLRYGITRFNGDTGGTILANCGAPTADIETAIDNIVASGWTPTAETMMDVMAYFQDSVSGPVSYECQRNFVIVVTDGFPTQDLNIPNWIGDQDGDGHEPGNCEQIGMPPGSNGDNCSDYLDDVAYYMANNDMRADLDGEQTIETYTIGFGIDAPLLLDTAENGNGLYRVAWNLDTLVRELGTVIGDIVNRISSGAAVAVVSTETGSDSHLYRGKFMPGSWQGFLEAYRLPYSDASAPEWEGGAILRDREAYTRNIFTSLAGVQYPFENTNAAALMPYLGAATEDTAAAIIDYVRGEHVEGFRDRNDWKLGDLVYSTPVVVGPPSHFYFLQSYQDFLLAHENRDHVVYVGANDGMLHAFNAETGKELWGYIPQEVLWKLGRLTDPNYCHQSFVDLSPVAYDVRIGGIWKTVLFGGQRSGGNSYFAIDVTDPHSPNVLWETSVPSILSSYTEPTLVNSQWGPLLWAGSGPDPSGGAHVVGLRIDNGSLLFAGTLSSIAGTNLMSGAVPFDEDWDGVHDHIYQGDLAGNLWRFDLTDSGGSISAYLVFQADGPIQAQPAITVTDDGKPMVFVGTGRYLEAADIGSTDQQWLYGVKDDPENPSTAYSGDLVDQTSAVNDAAGYRGWKLALDNESGERITQPATVVEGVVYASSFAPSNEPCLSGGLSWLYRVNFLDGDAIDTDEDGTASLSERSTSLGTGVASRPVINLAGEEVIVQTSDARLTIQDLAISPQRINVRAWRERFDLDPAIASEVNSQ